MPFLFSGGALLARSRDIFACLLLLICPVLAVAQVGTPPIAPPIQGPTDQEIDQLLGSLLKVKLADLPPGEHGGPNPLIATISNFIMIQRDIAAFQKEHEGRLPTEKEAEEFLLYYRDGWNSPIRYLPYYDKYAISSDGPDTNSGTWDDISTAKNGIWFDKLDSFFGKWIVTPIDAVIFFDAYPYIERFIPKGQQAPIAKPKLQLVIVCLFGIALFMTLRMAFINIRGFWHAVRLTMGAYDDPAHPGEVSHYQALSSALSGTIGLGNIAGISIAVWQGGPGAVFWLVLAGFFGMSSKFGECTLGQYYRKVGPDGVVSGGPMHYLRDGLAQYGLRPIGAVLAIIFAVLCILGSFGGGCSFQVGQSLNALREEPMFSILDRYPIIYGLAMAAMTGIVIIGGIKSIGSVAEKIVPLMCVIYVALSLFVIFQNYDKIIPSFQIIFTSAFTLKAGWGGFLGVMITGIRRASFSNEAGVGSAAIAHSAAKTAEPVSEGIVGLLEPFIDTVVVCTMSALVIVMTGAWDGNEFKKYVEGVEHARLVKAGDPDAAAKAKTVAEQAGAEMTRIGRAEQGSAVMTRAMQWGGAPWCRFALYAAVVLFAYATVISWSYYGERCWAYLFGEGKSIYFKFLFLGCVVLGSIITDGKILEFSDLMIFGMAFPNMIGLLFMSGFIKRELDKYWKKYKSGELQIHAKK